MLKISSIAKLTAISAVTSFACFAANAADRISDFSLVDADGRFFQLSRQADQEAIVLLSYDKDSRDARKAASDLAKLAASFADQPVTFAIINSTTESDKSVLRKEAADRKIGLRMLMDESQLVSEELGITRVAEAIVIDPVSKTVVYRGALDKDYTDASRSERNEAGFVEEALTALLAGQEITFNQLASNGDMIDFSVKEAHAESLSYANDIAPILEEKCVTCHQEGGIAPFAMSSLQMVQGWSPMIRETLITKRMPPGQIDKEYVSEFHDVYNISVEETQKLVHWIDNGSKNSGSSDPLAELVHTPVKWLNGEPDIIIDIPEQKIPATGVQDYRNIMIPLELDEDIWVKAVEFEAGDSTVLHHIIAFSYGDQGVNEFEILNQGIGLGAYAPGNELNLYPEGAGYPLKKGGGLMLQMHYTTSGKEAEPPRI